MCKVQQRGQAFGDTNCMPIGILLFGLFTSDLTCAQAHHPVQRVVTLDLGSACGMCTGLLYSINSLKFCVYVSITGLLASRDDVAFLL